MAFEFDIESLLLMGRIWRPHGVRGEVKVIPDTDDPERFSDLSVIFAGKTADAARRIEIESVRFQPTKKGTVVVLKLAGIDSREEADELRKTLLFAPADELPPLDEDEFFLHDLVGLQVVTEEGDEVGVVDNVLEMPGQEVIEVGREGMPPALVPAVSEFILEIDLNAEKIVIRPIEGLLE